MGVLLGIALGVTGLCFGYHFHHTGDDKKTAAAIKQDVHDAHQYLKENVKPGKITPGEFKCASPEVGACR